MSDEYEYGLGWIDVPKGGLIQLEGTYHGAGPQSFIATRYRIATPKPKRELVVGKWYFLAAEWRKCIAIEDGGAWFSSLRYRQSARFLSIPGTPINWAVSPRDEAPE